MKRQEFIDFFNEQFGSKNTFYHFDIEIEEVDDKVAITKAIEDHLMPFLNQIGITDTNILTKLNIDPDFDWDYAEEDPDGEFCKYNCKFNLHRLYDEYVLQSNFPLKTVTLYRIETKDGESLYNTGYAATKYINDNQPDPNQDPLLNSIFDGMVRSQDEEYKRQWYFAFSKLEDVYKWIGNNFAECMNEYNLEIKKIIVPTEFVVEGTGQTVFKKEHIVCANTISLDQFENKKVVKLSI